ncbi:hypothetical protein B0H14DRAFT_3893152 [Mycena olivaceomarginata]|nr:hypothetical protein B0H14DRAFT_3893152 [Mycena olivaceomarginata]
MVSQPSIKIFPPEVLAAILKLVADSPIPAAAGTRPPFPIIACLVSRQFRAVTLAFPELWNKIRLSHHSRSRSWAAISVKHSKSYPLDISISLEAYATPMKGGYRDNYDRPVPIAKALAIIEQFRQFIAGSSSIASQLEYAHISLVQDNYWNRYLQGFPPLTKIFGGSALRWLKTNVWFDLADLAAFRGIHTLDLGIDLSVFFDLEKLCPKILGPASRLKTLIVRNLDYTHRVAGRPIEVSTITSLVSMSDYYIGDYTFMTIGCFIESFAFPNLEYLEINGHFAAAIPENWVQAPLFPHLRVLRLEGCELYRNGLAFIHSFSQTITALELISTTGNHNLIPVSPHGDIAWPTVCSLTVEQADGLTYPKWLAEFLAMRASLGARISTLVRAPWAKCDALPATFPQDIRWLPDFPRPALADGVAGDGFYVDSHGMGQDFECETARSGSDHTYARSDSYDRLASEWREANDERVAHAFKGASEFVRAKGMCRQSKRDRHRDLKAERRSKMRRKHQRCDITEDFCCT